MIKANRTLIATTLAGAFMVMGQQAWGQDVYTIEAETGFKNIGDQQFVTEARDFYSSGFVIMVGGDAPIGESARVEYELKDLVPAGNYQVSVTYNDENDGHSPVEIQIDDQSFSFVMDDDTPSPFPANGNQRVKNIGIATVSSHSVLRAKGTVDRYKSDHRELVRLDKFVFTKVD